MRIGELIVFGSQGDYHHQFIKSVCNQTETIDDRLCIGRLPITNQLMLQFYGLNMMNEVRYSIDLLSPKVLGYIFLFNWDDQDTLEPMKETMDKLSSMFKLPIIVAAMVKNYDELSISRRYFESEGFILDSLSRFTFCDINDTASARKVTASLINIILNRIS
ncbi:hypothetical protein JXB12_04115 [candidate division KSB1 bacterium]|nr:hypothetical protein [candidate division KSB1 bacterium]